MTSGSELPDRRSDPAAKGAAEAERLAALAALVDKLSQEVEVLEGSSRREAVKRGIQQAVNAPPRRSEPTIPPADPAAVAAVERRIESLARQEARQEPKVPQDRVPRPEPAQRREPAGRPIDDRQAERLSGIETRLSAILDKFSAPQPQPARQPAKKVETSRSGGEIGGLQAAIAEISARQRTLDAEPARSPSQFIQPQIGASQSAMANLDAAAIEDALIALRTEIAAIGRRMAADGKRAQEVREQDLRAREAQAQAAREQEARLREAVAQRPAVDDRALATLRRELGDMRQAIELAARETTLASIESGYGHIIERLDDIVRRTPERDRLDQIAGEINRLGDSFERAQPSRAVEAELEDIRNALASLAAPKTDPGVEREIADLREAIGALVSRPRETVDLSRIERSLGGLQREFDSFTHGIDLSGLTRIEDRLDALASLAAPQRDPALEREIADLGDAIDALVSRPHETVDLSRIEQSLGGLQREFDNFASGIDLSGVSRIERDLAGVRQALASLETPRSALDSTALSRLEDRLDALAGRFDALAELPTLRAPLSADALEPIRAEIGQLRTEMESRGPISLDAIENEMRAIVQRLDGMGGRDDGLRLKEIEREIGLLRRDVTAQEPVAIDAIEQQMQALVTRFDRMDTRDDGRVLYEIGARIDALRQDVIAREPAGIDAIGEQMRALVHHLERATSHDDGDTLKQLEAQIAAMADRFAASEPVPDAIAKVEANLDRLQSLIDGAQNDTAELARDAARSAVSEFAGSMSRTDEALVAALREDLRILQAAASRSEQQTQEALETVHDTLAKVVGRIAELEVEEQAAPTQRPAAARVRPGEPVREDHRPLAPGSGKPNLSTLREAAGAPAPAERKADFIAAARRAAQAAQTEQTKIKADKTDADPEVPRTGAFAKLGQALRSRRRPIVLAIAAIVLALGAMQFSDSLIDGARRLTTMTSSDPVTTGSLVSDTAPIPVPTAALSDQTDDTALIAPKKDSAVALAVAPAKATSNKFSAVPDAPSAMSFAPAPETASVPSDTVLGGSNLLAAAGKGDPEAEFELGRRLAEGDGMKQDIALAANWYERAAKAGLAVAQYRIGSLYERGEGVKRDAATAQAWYEKAAQKGNAQAVHNLAVLLSEGANGQPDYPRAVKLFQQAALLGVADSQYNLGVLYARGLGVSVDLVQSYKWFALAAGQGDADAGKRRDEVAKAMAPDALASARAAVKGFKQAPLDQTANNEPRVRPEWQQAVGKNASRKPNDDFNG